jgi:hypothetical protein
MGMVLALQVSGAPLLSLARDCSIRPLFQIFAYTFVFGLALVPPL